uniref:Nose resistant-to-fluoxetine protein N-terminal domain-containing protein n=2 Tax=Clytia hemisphaerica TaxID=252671 RepID=A0A7M5UX06_9CNID
QIPSKQHQAANSRFGTDWFFDVDAWGKPPANIFWGNLKWNGAFDMCNRIPNAKYCLADMRVLGNKNQTYGQFGTCLPSDCSESDVFQLLNLTTPYVKGMVTFPADGIFNHSYGTPVLCNDKKDLPTDSIVFIVVLSLLGLLCFFGTAFEALQDCLTPDNLVPPQSLYNHQEYDQDPEEKAMQRAVNHTEDDKNDFNYSRFGTDRPAPPKMTRGNGLIQFLVCFSILKNTRTLISTSAPKDSIRSINGIRAISMTWVILGHVYFFGILTAPDNIVGVFKVNERFTFQAIANAYVSVDSFFFLSGFLVAYITLKKMDKMNGSLNFFAFVLHRFIRLTPSYMFAIFIQTSLYPYIVNSPDGLLVRAGAKNDQCHTHWWSNLLYINNIYPWKMAEECLGWSWYLANDMQFFVISPLFLFFMYRYKLKGALISIGSGILLSTIATIAIVAGKGLPSLISIAWLPGVPANDRAQVGIFGDDVYVKPWTRINPYLIGLLFGFLFSRKIYLTRKPNFAITFMGWAVATAIGMSIIYGPYSVFKPGGQLFDTAQNVLYGAFSRLAWALALAWVVYACQYRMGGWVNSFLSWSLWIPIGRLTYGAYLLHPIILNYYYKTMEKPWHFQDDTAIFAYLSVLMMSYMFAFLLSLLIDLPVYNLETMVTKNLSGGKK